MSSKQDSGCLVAGSREQTESILGAAPAGSRHPESHTLGADDPAGSRHPVSHTLQSQCPEWRMTIYGGSWPARRPFRFWQNGPAWLLVRCLVTVADPGWAHPFPPLPGGRRSA